MTVDEIIKKVNIKASGRTRYEGQEPSEDAILVDEIKRLREAILNYGNNPAGFDWSILEKLDQQEMEIERLRKLVDYYSCALERADQALLTNSLDSGIM